MKKIIFISSLVISAASYAASWSATSERGATFTFGVDGELTQATLIGSICNSESEGIKSVKLWMPAHNHGTTQTKISAMDARCARVDKLNFLMAGTWEVRIETNSGDKATITVDVP